ncbi:cellulase family glycosylhydrolase [Mucisphaera calidilacus]|uniref:Sugar-binding cellulase-like protein n=1 Tax=Mucisphaera calidilacus TaxID=2527982 RepID=A0A518BTM1_9BACT|nr:cellulase family glycosylhydrolase [Mucisphaera calidilacus]QDU70314.1 Sugar-binding cellulase-like protein [Mucisphaera calidilacus]
MTNRWTPEQAQNWADQHPWYCGANFYPSTAINQLEMWRAETFDPVTIDRELGWAAELGMNLMRVYLHDLLHLHDAEGLKQRVDAYLAIAHKHGIDTMLTLFDDCHRKDFAWGTQPEPVPFKHNSGWAQSPGQAVLADNTQWTRLQDYVLDVLDQFKDDPRVALWDLYNEPGNSPFFQDQDKAYSLEPTLDLLQRTFAWARSIELTQPITAGVFTFSDEFKALNDCQLDNSDIISFHSYDPPEQLLTMIERLQAHGRPLVCSEYMARTRGSTFQHCLPLLRRHNVAAINWGLVAGKSGTIYPWGWDASKGEPYLCFHDVFRPDGSMLYPEERQAITSVTQPG